MTLGNACLILYIHDVGLYIIFSVYFAPEFSLALFHNNYYYRKVPTTSSLKVRQLALFLLHNLEGNAVFY